MIKEIPITEKQLNDHWELIKGHMIPRGVEQQLNTDELNDISIIERKQNGKYRFKKHHNNKQIKIGDIVKKDDVTATVIDIDGDDLCCGIDGEIVIWKIDEVKKLK